MSLLSDHRGADDGELGGANNAASDSKSLNLSLGLLANGGDGESTADVGDLATEGFWPIKVLGGYDNYSDSAERQVVKKLDFHILPIITVCYLFNLLDRHSIGLARIANSDDDHAGPDHAATVASGQHSAMELELGLSDIQYSRVVSRLTLLPFRRFLTFS